MTVLIYGLTDPASGCIRYVGKTSCPLKKRYKEHIGRSKEMKTHKQRWIQTVLRDGKTPGVVVLEECTEDNWSEREVFWIASFPKEQLTNTSAGGRGMMHTPETLAKISGENSRFAKLNKQQVSEIKRLILTCKYSCAEIAKQYSVAKGTISDIGRGGCWNDVGPLISKEEWSAAKSATYHRRGQRISGENAPKSKLTTMQVVEIKNKILTCRFSLKEIAEQYGVCSEAIAAIARGENWQYVGPIISKESFERCKKEALRRRPRKVTIDVATRILEIVSTGIEYKYVVAKILDEFRVKISESYVCQVAMGSLCPDAMNECNNNVQNIIGDIRKRLSTTERRISEIKTKILSGEYTSTEIARQYGTYEGYITRIGKGPTWKDTEPKITEEAYEKFKKESRKRKILKLTPDSAQRILEIAATGVKYKQVAAKIFDEFQVHIAESSISSVVRGKTWPDAIDNCSKEVRDIIIDTRS